MKSVLVQVSQGCYGAPEAAEHVRAREDDGLGEEQQVLLEVDVNPAQLPRLAFKLPVHVEWSTHQDVIQAVK